MIYDICILHPGYTLATPFSPAGPRGPGARDYPGYSAGPLPGLGSAWRLYKAQCSGLEKAIRNEANINFRGNMSLN